MPGRRLIILERIHRLAACPKCSADCGWHGDELEMVFAPKELRHVAWAGAVCQPQVDVAPQNLSSPEGAAAVHAEVTGRRHRWSVVTMELINMGFLVA